MSKLLALPMFLVLALALQFSLGCSETVNPGEVGIVTDWGQVQPWVYPEGFHRNMSRF